MQPEEKMRKDDNVAEEKGRRRKRIKEFIDQAKKHKGGSIVFLGRDNDVVFNGDEPESESNTDSGAPEPVKIELPRSDEGVGGTHRLLNLITVFTVILSVSAVIFITVATVTYSLTVTPDDEILPSVNSDTDSEKIVFVRDPDDDSMLLSASELYETRKASVVTVFGKKERGDIISSGFVFTEDGYIATTHNGISECDGVTVMLSNGKKHSATVVSSDPFTDIALLKINVSGLSPVIFGASSQLLAGERVYTIGTPKAEAYAGTLFAGFVTYGDRKLYVYGKDGSLSKRINTIQTDIEIGSGNSGGPLFDGYGRVIGMMKADVNNGAEGISFALTSEGVGRVLRAMKGGKPLDADTVKGVATYAPSLGIKGEGVSVEDLKGVRISELYQCGSSAPTFLKKGDILVEIADRPVCSLREIGGVIEKCAPGESVSVTVLRSSQLLTFDIILGSKNDN